MWLDQHKTATQYTIRNDLENAVEEQLLKLFLFIGILL